MRIVVCGAGKLGFNIAQMLAEEQYDVVVVENDSKRREIVQGSLDVLAIEADCCSPSTFRLDDVKGANLLIAATDNDQVNMITCMLAKKNGIEHTVARIRTVDYAMDATKLLSEDMKIDLILNPEHITANEIQRILMTPNAINVEDFAEGRVRMFEAKLRDDSPFVGQPLKNLTIPRDILVAMVYRQHRIFIPNGFTVLNPGDSVYFVGRREAVDFFESRFINTYGYEKVEKVIIIGAGRTGRFLAPLLEKKGLSIKVIEKDKARCQLMSSLLTSGTVLCGDGTDMDLLTEEGAGEADAVVCITEDDKLNLLLALLAKHVGAKKTIVRVARNEYIELMEKVGVDVVLSTRMLSSGEVLRFVRKGGLVSVSFLEGALAEAMEIIVHPRSEVEMKALKDITFPQECLLCAIVRAGEVIIPNGNTVLFAEDRVILLVKKENAARALAMFDGRR